LLDNSVENKKPIFDQGRAENLEKAFSGEII
jgi:hypothetical protein